MTPDTRPAIVVGLMSGTSLDGISAAVVRFHADGAHELLAFRQLAYDTDRRQRLSAALNSGQPDEYCRLNFDLGHWLADAAVAVLADAGIARSDVAAIASHGQTVWHVPGHSTWQFGESAVITERTGIDVISDFRVRDVAAGGQGAPLVPIADAMLFSHPTAWRALQNFGGIGNVSIVPPRGDVSSVRAFDTGPGVVVIDAVTRRIDPALRFDDGGRLARSGSSIAAAVDEALSHPYFAAAPPKSTGRELFSPAWIDGFIASCRRHRPDATNSDLVATAVALTARSVSDAFRRFIPEPVSEILVSGGGAENPALMDALAEALPREVQVRKFADVYFDGEAKEAVAFALLGWLFLQRRPGNVVTVTGARGPRILGKLTPALHRPQ
ncbi:MAG TPA: anhydro-N-acetylmuramic acid kinase [Gemmatimonadaceae bacterium]